MPVSIPLGEARVRIVRPSVMEVEGGVRVLASASRGVWGGLQRVRHVCRLSVDIGLWVEIELEDQDCLGGFGGSRWNLVLVFNIKENVSESFIKKLQR